MLLVILPLALIHASVPVHEYSETVRFAFAPFSLVDISVNVSHPSFSFVQLVLGLTLIDRSILELDHSEAFPDVRVIRAPLSLVLFGVSY